MQRIRLAKGDLYNNCDPLSPDEEVQEREVILTNHIYWYIWIHHEKLFFESYFAIMGLVFIFPCYSVVSPDIQIHTLFHRITGKTGIRGRSWNYHDRRFKSKNPQSRR